MSQMNIMDGRIRLHTSDRSSFRRCRRKSLLSSKLWYGLQPVRPNKHLWLGSGVHKGIERYYGFNENPVAVFQDWAQEGIEEIRTEEGLMEEEKQVFEDTLELGTGMLEHYLLFAEKHDDFNVYVFPDGTPAVEILFEVPIVEPSTGEQLFARYTNVREGMNVGQVEELSSNGFVNIPVTYGGVIDLIVEDSMGDLWIFDHKTAQNFGDWSKLQLDTQVGSYIWALKQLVPDLDKHVQGVIYNGIRKSLPKEPQPLKRGGFSKNKAQMTTFDVYLKTLQDAGEPLDGYREILEHLAGQEEITADGITTRFFKRQKIRRSPAEVRSMGRDIFYEAVDMVNAQAFYPNPTRDCSWDCDFYEVCVGINNEEDVQWQLDSLFEKRSDGPASTEDAWQQEER